MTFKNYVLHKLAIFNIVLLLNCIYCQPFQPRAQVLMNSSIKRRDKLLATIFMKK